MSDTKKTLIIGDVHGCFKEFSALLKKADYNTKKHRLILVGDIINRGFYSLEMLEWVKNQKIEMVRGNHEQIFIDGVFKNTPLNPNLTQLKKDIKKNLREWMTWLTKLPFYIEGKDFLVVHAGLAPNKHPKDTNPYMLMNIRTWDGSGKNIKSDTNPPWHKYYKGKKTVIYGHWARQGLHITKNTIGLDTGCVYGNMLSGVLLPEKKILQVSALQKYFTPKNTTLK